MNVQPTSILWWKAEFFNHSRLLLFALFPVLELTSRMKLEVTNPVVLKSNLTLARFSTVWVSHISIRGTRFFSLFSAKQLEQIEDSASLEQGIVSHVRGIEYYISYRRFQQSVLCRVHLEARSCNLPIVCPFPALYSSFLESFRYRSAQGVVAKQIGGLTEKRVAFQRGSSSPEVRWAESARMTEEDGGL